MDRVEGGSDFVVVPSYHIPVEMLQTLAGVEYYEHRCLFMLFHLGLHPRHRLILVLSHLPDPPLLHYYASLIDTPLSIQHVLDRVEMVHVDGGFVAGTLTQRLLRQTELVEHLKAKIRQPVQFVCYNHSEEEDTLQQMLGVVSKDARGSKGAAFWGTKCGSRRLFLAAKVPHPFGNYECLYSLEELAECLDSLLVEKPGMSAVVIKSNEGASGMGNAVLRLNGKLKSLLRENLLNRRRLLGDFIRKHLAPCSKAKFEDFMFLVQRYGAIIEEYVCDISEISSPSVQGMIEADGSVKVVSTHDQLLDGQIYKGCVFPARQSFRDAMIRVCSNVGEILKQNGAVDDFGVDFIAFKLRGSDELHLEAIEINLRQLGTTHPMRSLMLLTKGSMDAHGTFHDSKGNTKCYVASDCLQKPNLLGVSVSRFLERVQLTRSLHFSKTLRQGVIFIMLQALQEHGRLGMICIGSSVQHAQTLFFDANRELDLLSF